ncbi:Adenylate kinase [Bertholletia excelsa]
MSFVEHSFAKPHFRYRSKPSFALGRSLAFPDQNSLPSRLLTAAMAGLCRLTAVVQPATRRRIGTIARRSYGSAAVAYDYDYEEYESEPYRFTAMEDTEGSVPARGVQWVIMGDPPAKKHVYAERLSELLQVPHISMGALVRQELHPQSSLYKQIANAVNQGRLVPEEIIFGLLSKRLEEGLERGETGFILDGIPRTRMQAEILDKIADIDLVVNFKCTEECF